MTEGFSTAELWSRRLRSRSRWLRRQARWAARRGTNPLRALPDFLVIGAAKSGTTSLFRYLAEHPLVIPPVTKEIRYFAYHSERSLGWYRAHFPMRSTLSRTGRDADGTALTGEASPAYLPHPAAPERAARVVPDAKLIAVLRNPVDRAISAYHFAVQAYHETRPIEQAMAGNLRGLEIDEPLSAHDDLNGALRLNNYLSRGHYAEGLARWYHWYGPEKVLVVETDELSRGGGTGFERVLGFLGLRQWRPPAFQEHNVGTYAPAPTSLRAELARHFEPHNKRLWDLIGVEWDWDDGVSQ